MSDINNTLCGILENIDALYRMVDELKSIKRSLVTNLFLDTNTLSDLIDNNEIHYEYVPGNCLNLFIEEWDFCHLYFFMTSPNEYQAPKSDGMMICELFFNREDDDNRILIDSLNKAGFSEYASYHRWLKTRQEETAATTRYAINKGQEKGFYDLLLKNFDVLSDHVPQKNEFETYIKDKECYSAVDSETGKLLGGLIFSKKGNVETEEFVFTDPEYRHRGLASALHENWYNSNKVSKTRYMAWIRDDNQASIGLHRKFAYERQKMYKVTMKRSKDGR